MERPLLTARWTNLVLTTCAVKPEVLETHMPPGCEPGLIDGQAVSPLRVPGR